MRFFYVKKPQICQGCKSEMLYNDEAVCILIKIGDRNIPMVYHTHCYLEWNEKMFYHRLEQFQLGTLPRPRRVRRLKPKMGRPRKYTNPIHANNLKSLIRFHRLRGNEERIQELLAELESITIKKGLTNPL